MKTTHKIIIGAIVIILVAFYGGLKYGENKTVSAVAPSGFAGRTGGTGTGAARFTRGAGGNGVSGQILTKDDTSITVSVQGGGSRVVFLGTSTPVMKTTAGSFDDLTVGSNVMVIGQTNTNGSVNATAIQLRPASAPVNQ